MAQERMHAALSMSPDAGAQALVQLLTQHRDNEAVQEACFMACRDFAENDVRRSSLLDAGAGPAIIQGMDAHSTNINVQLYGFMAIGNTAMGEDGVGTRRDSLVADGALSAIVASMRNHAGDSAFQQNCCMACRYIMGDDSDARKDACVAAGVPAAVVAFMETPEGRADVMVHSTCTDPRHRPHRLTPDSIRPFTTAARGRPLPACFNLRPALPRRRRRCLAGERGELDCEAGRHGSSRGTAGHRLCS
jgi:hypothetical protein